MEPDKITGVHDAIKIARRRLWGLAIPALSIFLISVAVAFLWQPVYRSTSTVLIEEQEIPPEYVLSTLSSYAEERLQAINQRIMSSARLLEIINRFNLYADKRDKWSTEEITDKMRKKDIKFGTVVADVIDPRTGSHGSATIAFTVSYEGRNPQLVQQVDATLASLYLEENLKVVNRKTEDVTKFLDDEMETVHKQLTELEEKIAAYKEKHPHALPELFQFNMQSLDWSERSYDQFASSLRTLRERESYLKAQLATMAPDAVNQDKDQLKQLRVALVGLKAKYSDEYPDVIRTKEEISQLEKRIGAGDSQPAMAAKPDNPSYIALASDLASVQSDIKSTKQQMEDLEKKRDEYAQRLEMSPKVEEGYKNLMVQRNDTQAKYDDLMKKYMESKVARSGLEKEQMGERFTLIDPAALPEKPVRPNRPIIMLIGLILGLGAGFGTVSLQESMDSSARQSRDLAAAFPLPVLTEIPQIITAKDELRKKRRFGAVLGTIILLLLSVPIIIQFFVMDLDVLWARIVRHM